MFKKFYLVFLIIPCFLFVGCTPNLRTPMTLANRQKIRSDELVVNMMQHNIQPSIGDSGDIITPVTTFSETNSMSPMAAGLGGMMGGMIGGIILDAMHHHQLNVATKEMSPIQTNLKNFHYSAAFRASLTPQLNNIKWLKIKDSDLQYQLTSKKRKALLHDPKTPTILFVAVKYNIDTFFKTLFVRVSVQLDHESRKQNREILFQNNYIYFVNVDKKIKTLKERVAWWDDHIDFIKTHLTQSTQLIGRMIALDIEIPDHDPYQKMQTQVVKFNPPFQSPRQTGKIAATVGNNVIVRAPDETMYAFRG